MSKFYLLSTTSIANNASSASVGSIIKYKIEGLDYSRLDIDDVVLGFEAEPVNQVRSMFKVSSKSTSDLILTKHIETLTGVSIEDVRPAIDSYIARISSTSFLEEIDQNLAYQILERLCNVSVPVVITTSSTMPSVPECDIDKNIENRTVPGYNTIYYGAPGTGKSHEVNRIISGHPHRRITFHPETDYASFVGCYKPNMSDDGKNIRYSFIAQTFILSYIDAWEDLLKGNECTKKMHYIVIEELNRGNCAQIFGDIFQLLDRKSKGKKADDSLEKYPGFSNYIIQAEKELAEPIKERLYGSKYLECLSKIYDKELTNSNIKLDYNLLALPANLTILATMNTSDQSLFPMDSAFKRRWNWKYIAIKPDNVKDWILSIDSYTFKWCDILKSINTLILNELKSADKQLGERFIKPDEEQTAGSNEFNKISYDLFRDKVLFFLFNDAFKDNEDFSSYFSLKKDNEDTLILFESLYNDADNIKRCLCFLRNINENLKTQETTPKNIADITNEFFVGNVED